jgi:hypothetical protein
MAHRVHGDLDVATGEREPELGLVVVDKVECHFRKALCRDMSDKTSLCEATRPLPHRTSMDGSTRFNIAMSTTPIGLVPTFCCR